MSDGLLSGLRKSGDMRDPDEFNPVLCADWYNEALDDVAEALTNLSDEQVEAIDQAWRDYHYSIYDTITGQLRCACGEAQTDLHRIRVYLAAAAGGDDQTNLLTHE